MKKILFQLVLGVTLAISSIAAFAQSSHSDTKVEKKNNDKITIGPRSDENIPCPLLQQKVYIAFIFTSTRGSGQGYTFACMKNRNESTELGIRELTKEIARRDEINPVIIQVMPLTQ